MNKLSLLNNTPVDLVYKYIDLSDPALNRTDSVRKDFDNNELRYSIRSALKNIPWIRYIYIIMPNERVSFLKSADLISQRIKYIKDNDLLGFDSSSSTTFEYNLWRLKDFGCSEHIIYANDDNFFGNPLKKEDRLDLYKHEYAHYMQYNFHIPSEYQWQHGTHGSAWKYCCSLVGAAPTPYYIRTRQALICVSL